MTIGQGQRKSKACFTYIALPPCSHCFHHSRAKELGAIATNDSIETVQGRTTRMYSTFSSITTCAVPASFTNCSRVGAKLWNENRSRTNDSPVLDLLFHHDTRCSRLHHQLPL